MKDYELQSINDLITDYDLDPIEVLEELGQYLSSRKTRVYLQHLIEVWDLDEQGVVLEPNLEGGLYDLMTFVEENDLDAYEVIDQISAEMSTDEEVKFCEHLKRVWDLDYEED